ncbi:hypothetical protein QBC39DRAFT_425626 [Podospora conica]|nr:hypothetical protein QBC39DRAFT_425626 [Schizothecium conicum]
MSSTRPVARSLLSRRLACSSTTTPTTSSPAAPFPFAFPISRSRPSPACHALHTSAPLAARRRPRFPSVSAEKMGLVWSKDKIDKFTADKFTPYSPEEMDLLQEQLPPEQAEAVRAAEAAIDPRDLTVQGVLRTDPFAMPYIDDFRDIQPIIDRRPRTQPPPDPTARFMNLDEFTQDLVAWADKFQVGEKRQALRRLEEFAPAEWQARPEKEWPEQVKRKAHDDYLGYLQIEAANSKKEAGPDGQGTGPTDADILEYVIERSIMTDDNLQSQSFLAPALPRKVPGVAGMYRKSKDDEDIEDTYQNLKRRTGMTISEITKIWLKEVDWEFVSNQTRLGKIRSQRLVVIAGNKKGWLGVGVGKSTEPKEAKTLARIKAIENMQPIRRYENRTIYGNVKVKISGTVVELFARPPGFGLRVPSRLFEMARAVGIRDLAARIPRSRNGHNTIMAAFQALQNQPDPEEIARGRGKKLVDARKVYYGGNVE